MNSYLIGFAPSETAKDYKPVIEKIKTTFPYWWHHLDTTLIVKSDYTAVQIRDMLQPLLDIEDKLLVARLSGEGAWKGFSDKGSKWLKTSL